MAGQHLTILATCHVKKMTNVVIPWRMIKDKKGKSYQAISSVL
jgi:hypothetical protein